MRSPIGALAAVVATSIASALLLAPASPAHAATAAPSGSASAALAALPVKGRAPMTGYSRDQFGTAWTDANDDIWGHNGLDTRNDILSRDLVNITCKTAATTKSAPHCTVATGTLAEPYTGNTESFVRGAATSTAVQIDHVVALGNAWVTGAQTWTTQERTDYANDPLVLIAADGPANEQKGDGDAATWLPSNSAFRCAYVARQIAIKTKYGLWVTAPEQAAMQRVLASCPVQTLPGDGTAPTATTWAAPTVTRHKSGCAAKKTRKARQRCRARRHHSPATAVPSPAPTTSPAPISSGTSNGGSVYYANCDAVRAAGKAPLYAGQPGYRPGLDRDGDGVACE